MPKKQHSEEQIISALKQYEGGEKTADICCSWASARPPSTGGGSSTPASACRSCASCVACARKTAGLTADLIKSLRYLEIKALRPDIENVISSVNGASFC
jgi:hypothetical protein